MNHTISPDRKRLTITVDESEREQLRNWNEERIGMDDENFQSDDAMHNFLEPLVCNSELEWINPADTGDLTDAPMLGILGEETLRPKGDKPRGMEVITGAAGGRVWISPILERWAYMDYAVRSPLEDLRDTGECVFVAE